MIRTFLNLFIALGFIVTIFFGHDETSNNFSDVKGSPKIKRCLFERKTGEDLKIAYDEKIKSYLNNVSEFRTGITSVSPDTIENNKNTYNLNDKFSTSHHIMIIKKGNHYPSVII